MSGQVGYKRRLRRWFSRWDLAAPPADSPVRQTSAPRAAASRVHAGRGVRLAALILILGAVTVLAYPLEKDQAAAMSAEEQSPASAAPAVVVLRHLEEIPPVGIPTPAASAVARPRSVVLRPATEAAPSEDLAPVMGVVWSPQAAVVHLRAAPNGAVVGQLVNGARLELLGERREAGGLAWLSVLTANGAMGWVAESLLLPAAPDQAGGIVVVQAAEPGGQAHLRAAPGGNILASLWDGTVLQALEEREVNERFWVHVVAPDGQDGWVAETLLSP